MHNINTHQLHRCGRNKNRRKSQIAKSIHNHNRINSGKRIKKFTTLLDFSSLFRSHVVSQGETAPRQS